MADTALAPRVLKAGSARTSPLDAYLGHDAEAERRLQAQAELDAAVTDAYRRGMQDGRDAAVAEGTAAIPDLAAGIAAAVERVAIEAAAQVETDTSSLLAVAVEVATWMVGEQAAADPSVLTGRLTAALDGLGAAPEVEIEVAPVQVDAVQAWADRSVSVIANPALGPADALVRAGAAAADLRLDEAARRALEALLG